MDSFIFPSLWEGLGISVIEAETNGLQCFVSNNVPDEVDIGAELVEFIDLNNSSDYWVEKILKKNKRRDFSPIDIFKKSGYDIEKISQWYENFYLTL